MLNDLLIRITNYVGEVIHDSGHAPYLRQKYDPRLAYYHGIGDGQSPCMRYLRDETIYSTFVEQIKLLEQRYILVALDEVVDTSLNAVKQEGFTRPQCSITFDDGLGSVYRHAYPFLKERGIPFAVFVNTSTVDNVGLLWLHKLGYLLSTIGDTETINLLNSQMKGFTKSIPASSEVCEIEQWCRKWHDQVEKTDAFNAAFDELGLDAREIAREQDLYLTWTQMDEMASNNVSFYSHTHRHLPLAALKNVAVVKEEMSVAMDVVATRSVLRKEFFSFPFGMPIDYGKHNVAVALAEGHDYVVDVGNGINTRERIVEDRLLSRVGLGSCKPTAGELLAALEIRPVIKSKIDTLRWLRP